MTDIESLLASRPTITDLYVESDAWPDYADKLEQALRELAAENEGQRMCISGLHTLNEQILREKAALLPWAEWARDHKEIAERAEQAVAILREQLQSWANHAVIYHTDCAYCFKASTDKYLGEDE